MIKSTLGIYRHGVKLSNKTVHENPLPTFDVKIFCQHTFSDETRQISQYKKQKAAPRGGVKEFSRKSKKRLSWVYNQYDWKSMITFTYHKKYPEDGAISKRHLHNVTKQIDKSGIKYLWVLEWQGRGFPHYHIWLSRELTKREKASLVDTWLYATREYNDTGESRRFHDHESIYTPWNMSLGIDYAVKYAYKSEQKGLPLNVASYGRWYGHSRMDILPDIEYVFNDAGGAEYAQMVAFNRNVHRCIRHWSKNKKKKVRVDSKKGYTFVLSAYRREAIKKLFTYHFGVLTSVIIPEWVENASFARAGFA